MKTLSRLLTFAKESKWSGILMVGIPFCFLLCTCPYLVSLSYLVISNCLCARRDKVDGEGDIAKHKILNVGCGNETFGTHRVDKFPTDATTHVFDVENGLLFPDSYFDEIYSRNLLEHLRNVGFFLDECHRVLKENGVIRIVTDNAACMRYYAFGTHTGRYEKKHPDKHFSVFTRSHLKNHFSAAGFVDIKICFVTTDTPGHSVDRILHAMKVSSIVQFTFPRLEVLARK